MTGEIIFLNINGFSYPRLSILRRKRHITKANEWYLLCRSVIRQLHIRRSNYAPHGGCGRYQLWRSSYSLTVAVTYVLHVLWDLEYGASERKVLTHWVWDEWDNILQTTFSSVFSSMKMFEFRLKFVPKGPINNIPAFIKIMAWCRPGDKSLSEPMMVSLLMHIIVTRPQWVNYG